MAQFKFTWIVNGLQKSKLIEAENQEQAEFLWEFQIGKPSQIEISEVKKSDFIEKLRFHHSQSLANLRMIEECDDQEERSKWFGEYAENQIALMDIQKIQRSL
jgi:hypothetical protein